MSFLDFFKNKKGVEQENPIESVDCSSDEGVTSITAPKESSLTVSYATGWPIDLIYGYLHKNYEEKGYADAMLNNNFTFRDMNMSIIRNKILMIFREVKLKYQVMSQDLETRIETCNAAGLINTIAELEKQMAVIVAHTNELNALELDFRNNEKTASVPLMSYECGFLRGISAIVLSSPSSVKPVTETPMATFFKTNSETA